MKTKLLLTIALVCMAVTASADNYKDMESLTLSTPEMKAELVPVANHKALWPHGDEEHAAHGNGRMEARLRFLQVEDQSRREALQVHGRADVRGCTPVCGRYCHQGRQGHVCTEQ